MLDHQLEDVVADGDVQARDRLVGDDHIGLEHHRPGDAHPLALAARELVRVAIEIVARRPQAGASATALTTRSSLSYWLCTSLLTSSGSATMSKMVCLGLIELYGSWKMICAFLRYSRSARCEKLPQRQALVPDLTAGRLLEAQHGAAGGRLAAARLTDQGQDLALLDVERDPIHGAHELLLGLDHGLDEAFPNGEEHLQVTDLEERAVGDGGGP